MSSISHLSNLAIGYVIPYLHFLNFVPFCDAHTVKSLWLRQQMLHFIKYLHESSQLHYNRWIMSLLRRHQDEWRHYGGCRLSTSGTCSLYRGLNLPGKTHFHLAWWLAMPRLQGRWIFLPSPGLESARVGSGKKRYHPMSLWPTWGPTTIS